MSVTIIRFGAGCCGETVLKLLWISYPEAKLNITFDELTSDGRTGSTPDYKLGDNIAKIGMLPEFIKTVDFNELNNELDQLETTGNDYFLKCHMTRSNDILDRLAIDIKPSFATLPFIVSAISNKVPFFRYTPVNTALPTYSKLHSNPKLTKFNNIQVIYNKISRYSTIQSQRQMYVDDMFKGWDHLVTVFKQFNLYLSNEGKAYYESWLDLNSQLLPSQTYLNYIKEHNYNYRDTSLSEIEQYCLLLISKTSN